MPVMSVVSTFIFLVLGSNLHLNISAMSIILLIFRELLKGVSIAVPVAKIVMPKRMKKVLSTVVYNVISTSISDVFQHHLWLNIDITGIFSFFIKEYLKMILESIIAISVKKKEIQSIISIIVRSAHISLMSIVFSKR